VSNERLADPLEGSAALLEGEQTVAAPVLTAVLYLLVFGHVLEGRVMVYDRIPYTAFRFPVW
jgi:hypothetical protein